MINQHIKLKRTISTTTGLLLMMLMAFVQAAVSPTINLFPTSVVEDLKLSSEAAQGMEQSLHPVVKQLEEQYRLYQESKCDGAEGDAGCAALKKSLGEGYKAFLDELLGSLPQVKSAMANIKNSVGGRIAKEMGGNMTPRDLQRMLDGNGQPAKRVRHISGKRKGRISSVLSKYREMVAMGPNQGEPMAVLASDIYLDARETLEEVNMIQADIARAKVLIDVGGIYFDPSPQMMATVGAVKGLLFGEVSNSTIPNDNFQGEEPGSFDDSSLVIR